MRTPKELDKDFQRISLDTFKTIKLVLPHVHGRQARRRLIECVTKMQRLLHEIEETEKANGKDGARADTAANR